MSFKRLLKKVAPLIAGSIGGPFGGIASKFLADKLGVQEDSVEQTIAKASPDMLAHIKAIDNEFKIEMEKLGINREQLHSDDRKDARQMAANTSLLPQAIIATVFITGFILVLYVVFKGEINLEGNQLMLANVLLGILSAGVMQIMNFFFGSSSGSKEKTARLTSTTDK